MISLQTNIDSLIAQQNLSINSKFQSHTIQQLTSGYRINSSGDDAAGLSVANQNRNQIAQITQGVANGNNGTAQLQIMDGGMSNISQILDRLQTLAVQSASSSFTGNRADLNAEFQSDVNELNRQAQAIGLNTGGTFAQTMDVYLGGGGGASTAAVSSNAQILVDLSHSTVDAHSLGLAGMGMQVVAGSVDISSNSSLHSAYQIVTNGANQAAINNGPTKFYISGPGFSDNSKAALSVSLTSVSDINTLVTAINSAITTTIASGTPAALALQTAGITASVSTDATGAQKLAFSSQSSAFQVEAGDQMANALMGNLVNPNTSAVGKSIATTVTGGTVDDSASFVGANVTVQISGAGLANPVTINLTGQSTVGDAISDLIAGVNDGTQHPELAAAGIRVTSLSTGDAAVQFTSATGEKFSVQATGDTDNLLGLGALDSSSDGTDSGAFYSSITGGDFSLNTGNGLATLGFSFNGGPTDGGVTVAHPVESAATFSGTAITLSSGNLNSTGLGTLSLSVNGHNFTMDFADDANNFANTGTANESLTNVVKFINSQVNAQMGWGSDVKLATITGGSSNIITLTDPYADTSSTLAITGGTSLGALHLSQQTATGTDAVGNTVTVNMAGGDASKATYSAQADADALVNGIKTNTATPPVLNFTIDNTAVSADFADDANIDGGVAVLTGTKIGTGPTSTIDMSQFEAKGGALVGTALGGSATIDTASLLAQSAVYTGNRLGATGTMDTASLLAQKAVFDGSDVNASASAALSLTGSVKINTITVTLGTTDDLTTVASKITGSAAGVDAAVKQNAVTGSYYLELKSKASGTGANTTIDINPADAGGGTDALKLGLIQPGQTTNHTHADGTAAQLLRVSVGGTPQNIDFSLDINADAAETQTEVLHFLNGYSTDSQARQLNNGVASFDSYGALVITSDAKGQAVQVAVDNTSTYTAAAQALGLAAASQATGLTADGADAKKLSIAVGTAGATLIDFTNDGAVDAAESQADVETFLNSQLTGATAAFDTNGVLTITNDTKGATTASRMTVSNSATYGEAAQTLGLTTAGQTTSITEDGTAAQKLSFNVDGLGSVDVDFTGDANIDAITGQEALSDIADRINLAVANVGGNPYAAYTDPVAQVVDGALTITGLVKGSDASTGGSVVVQNGAAALTLGLNSAGAAKTVRGTDETVQQVLDFLNTSTQQALGLSKNATIFSLQGTTVNIDSQTKGAKSNILMTADAGGVLAGLGITASATALASGAGPTLGSVAATLTQAFKDNTTLRQAGLVATAVGNDLQIASSADNNTSFRLAEYDTNAATNLGFEASTGPFSAVLNSGLSKATLLDAGGTSAIGAGTTASPYLSFKPLMFGTDAQAITFTANNAAGVQQPLTLTLRNDTLGGEGGTSGATIDAAVSYINSKLQASDNTTLQSILAVKENVNGVEQINFISSLSSFSVSVGGSVNGNGVNGGVAQTFGSVANGAANNSAIDTLEGAQAAVTAVTAAVKSLGSAQATVGKGQNQLSYAVSLAQSQITNISAAQSQIRDANVAQEAANMTKAQVLQQATIAAMAQANQEPQAVLRLLQQ